MEPTHLRDLPLRERKRAQTRLALVDAFVERLDERPAEDIPVKEICDAVGVSEPTFFNYFATKGDLLTYFIQLWSVETSAVARRVEREHDSGLAAIEALFAHTATAVAEHPSVMLELIAHQARMPADLELPEVARAERLLRFPDVEGVLELPAEGLGAILPVFLARAVARGELPPDTDVKLAMLGATSIFFGVPLVLARREPGVVGALYRRLLSNLWAGFRHVEA